MKTLLVLFLFAVTAYGQDSFCSKDGLLADVGVTMRYQDDKSLWGYSDITFGYRIPHSPQCSMESRNLVLDKVTNEGYVMSYSYLSSDENKEMNCSCSDHSLYVSFSGCKFKIDFDDNRYPREFVGSCIVNEGNKQRLVEYVPLPQTKGKISSAVNLDGPVIFRPLIRH